MWQPQALQFLISHYQQLFRASRSFIRLDDMKQRKGQELLLAVCVNDAAATTPKSLEDALYPPDANKKQHLISDVSY